MLAGKIDLSEYTEVKSWMERMKNRKSIGPIMDASQH
jgi:glutathione S-transferase